MKKIKLNQLLYLMQLNNIGVGPSLNIVHIFNNRLGCWISGEYKDIKKWLEDTISAEHDILVISFSNLEALAKSISGHGGGNKEKVIQLSKKIYKISSFMTTDYKQRYVKEIADYFMKNIDKFNDYQIFAAEKFLTDISMEQDIIFDRLVQRRALNMYCKALKMIPENEWGPVMEKAAQAAYRGAIDSSPNGPWARMDLSAEERVFPIYGPDGVGEEMQDTENYKRQLPMYSVAAERAREGPSKYYEINMGTAFEFGDYMRETVATHGRYVLWNDSDDKNKLGAMGINS
ncbi:MAG: hypothetical protein AABY32_02695 [Nanoarchaeota archaeon]